MEVSNGTAAGKTEAARKSTDKTGAAKASADRRAAEADSDTACGEPTTSHRGGPCHLVWYQALPIVSSQRAGDHQLTGDSQW